MNVELGKHNLCLSGLLQVDPRPDSLSHHKWSWTLEDDGSFSVSSLRRAIDDLSLKKQPSPSRWLNLVPSKINVFTWRVNLKRLPTKINLSKRGVVCLSSLCPMCEAFDEDECHLFRDCRYVVAMWRAIRWNLDLQSIPPLNQLLDWGKLSGFKGVKESVFSSVVATALWVIWCSQNDKVFKGVSSDPSLLLSSQMQTKSFFWIKNRSKGKLVNLNWPAWCCNTNLCF